MDNIFLVQEAIDSSQKRDDKGMVIKLEMKKSFDQVKHSYLFKVMKQIRFDEQFI